MVRVDVVIWRADNVSEFVLAAMACWWLRDAGTQLLVSELPDGRHVGTHTPSALAALWQSARPLSAAECAGLAADFEAFRSDGGARRRWLDGRVVSAPLSVFDDLLASACTHAWEPAIHVVGKAMTSADRRDGLSDIFLGSRLVALIGAGAIEADHPPTRLRDFAIRLGS